MVRVIRVDFDFVAAFGGLAEVDIGACGGAFGDDMAGVVGEVDSGALQGAFGNEMADGLGDEFRGPDSDVGGDKLVDSVVSVLRVLFLRVDLDIAIVLELIIEAVLGCPSEVDAVCALATSGDLK
jgi:hypothetical protein